MGVQIGHGVAASGHPLATEAALALLARGGNAIDAANIVVIDAKG